MIFSNRCWIGERVVCTIQTKILAPDEVALYCKCHSVQFSISQHADDIPRQQSSNNTVEIDRIEGRGYIITA